MQALLHAAAEAPVALPGGAVPGGGDGVQVCNDDGDTIWLDGLSDNRAFASATPMLVVGSVMARD